MVIRRPTLYESFKKEIQIKKAIYICGTTGWGKATTILDWLGTEAKSHTYISVNQEDYQVAIAEKFEKGIRKIGVNYE